MPQHRCPHSGVASSPKHPWRLFGQNRLPLPAEAIRKNHKVLQRILDGQIAHFFGSRVCGDFAEWKALSIVSVLPYDANCLELLEKFVEESLGSIKVDQTFLATITFTSVVDCNPLA